MAYVAFPTSPTSILDRSATEPTPTTPLGLGLVADFEQKMSTLPIPVAIHGAVRLYDEEFNPGRFLKSDEIQKTYPNVAGQYPKGGYENVIQDESDRKNRLALNTDAVNAMKPGILNSTGRLGNTLLTPLLDPSIFLAGPITKLGSMAGSYLLKKIELSALQETQQAVARTLMKTGAGAVEGSAIALPYAISTQQYYKQLNLPYSYWNTVGMIGFGAGAGGTLRTIFGFKQMLPQDSVDSMAEVAHRQLAAGKNVDVEPIVKDGLYRARQLDADKNLPNETATAMRDSFSNKIDDIIKDVDRRQKEYGDAVKESKSEFKTPEGERDVEPKHPPIKFANKLYPFKSHGSLVPGTVNLDEASVELSSNDSFYHGTVPLNIMKIIKSKKILPSVSSLDEAGQNVISLTSNIAVAESFGSILEIDRKGIDVFDSPKSIKMPKGLEVRTKNEIPLTKIKKVIFPIGTEEDLGFKIYNPRTNKKEFTLRDIIHELNKKNIPVEVWHFRDIDRNIDPFKIPEGEKVPLDGATNLERLARITQKQETDLTSEDHAFMAQLPNTSELNEALTYKLAHESDLSPEHKEFLAKYETGQEEQLLKEGMELKKKRLKENKVTLKELDEKEVPEEVERIAKENKILDRQMNATKERLEELRKLRDEPRKLRKMRLDLLKQKTRVISLQKMLDDTDAYLRLKSNASPPLSKEELKSAVMKNQSFESNRTTDLPLLKQQEKEAAEPVTDDDVVAEEDRQYLKDLEDSGQLKEEALAEFKDAEKIAGKSNSINKAIRAWLKCTFGQEG